jgi:hypothetical protein
MRRKDLYTADSCDFLQCIGWIATVGGKKFITALSSLGENSHLYPSSMAPTHNALQAVKYKNPQKQASSPTVATSFAG